MRAATRLSVRQAKVRMIELYAEHVRKELQPIAFGLKARGCTDDEIEERIEALRPAFEQGINDVLLQVTVAGLRAGACDDGWAELSIDMLRKAFDRPAANPALRVKELAAGLRLLEETGVVERDGKLYLPNVEPQSPIARMDF
jgi:hypothetical protein